MNVLITGATGYLGANLTIKLCQVEKITKIQVLARSREKGRALSSRIADPERVEFRWGDLMEWQGDLNDVDAVIHLAAVRGPQYCEAHSAEAIEMNIEGTRRLVEMARQAGIPRFIFVSSQIVYGKQDTVPFHEALTPYPQGVYAVTKYAGEVITRSLENSQTKFAILRPSRVYGFGLFMRWEELLGKFAMLTAKGERLSIYGDGEQLVDLVHVKDVGEFILTLLMTEREEVWNQVYNVGGGQPISINELANIYIEAARELGLNPPPKDFVAPEIQEEVRAHWLDTTKARNHLGWATTTTIKEDVEELIQARLDARD